MARAGGGQRFFACELAFAVNALRVDGIGFAVGSVGGAVENVVGGNVENGGTVRGGGFGQMAHGVAVDGVGGVGVALGFIHGSIGGGVDNQLGAEG